MNKNHKKIKSKQWWIKNEQNHWFLKELCQNKISGTSNVNLNPSNKLCKNFFWKQFWPAKLRFCSSFAGLTRKNRTKTGFFRSKYLLHENEYINCGCGVEIHIIWSNYFFFSDTVPLMIWWFSIAKLFFPNSFFLFSQKVYSLISDWQKFHSSDK